MFQNGKPVESLWFDGNGFFNKFNLNMLKPGMLNNYYSKAELSESHPSLTLYDNEECNPSSDGKVAWVVNQNTIPDPNNPTFGYRIDEINESYDNYSNNYDPVQFSSDFIVVEIFVTTPNGGQSAGWVRWTDLQPFIV